MTDSIVLLDPVAAAQGAAHEGVLGVDDLAGKVVGFIDNAKPNFNHLVDDLAELLMSRHGVARVVKHRKPGQVPVGDATLDPMALECDLVITGSGD
jgi:hypothetical protein